MKKFEITAEIINDLFRYEDGMLIRKVTITKYARKGDIVGTVGKSGYISFSVVGTMFLLHRAIFLMHHGYLPKYVDHIDGNPLNNRIENLREANAYQNAQNQKLYKTNTSGTKGVSYNKLMKKWEANITANGKRIRLGWFDSRELAKEIIDKARTESHKDFARHK